MLPIIEGEQDFLKLKGPDLYLIETIFLFIEGSML